MDEREVLRNRLTEALVELIRTAGAGSFALSGEKERVFFSCLALTGQADCTEEALTEALQELSLLRKKLTAPKCVGCEGAPDLTKPFSVEEIRKAEPEIRALKRMLLSSLRYHAAFVMRREAQGRHDPELCAAFYRAMFVIGEDLAEEDLLQIACGMDAVCETLTE